MVPHLFSAWGARLCLKSARKLRYHLRMSSSLRAGSAVLNPNGEGPLSCCLQNLTITIREVSRRIAATEDTSLMEAL